MTEFDPKLVAEILERRYRGLERQGIKVGSEMWTALWSGHGHLYPKLVREMQDERDRYYRQADRTQKVLHWLYCEIEERRTPAEKIWLEIVDDDANFGPEMVQDVLDAGARLDILSINS